MPEILVFFGLIASGKSTLAEAIARSEGMLYLNTDRVRKKLAGIEATKRRPDALGQGIYSPEYTKLTYQAMLAAAKEQVRQGGSVVLDGSYSRRENREGVLECGRKNGAVVYFILCTCSDQEVRRRLALRARDPLAVSDGRWDIYLRQKESFEQPDELKRNQLLILNTEEEPDLLLGRIRQWLKEEYLNSKP